jgi:hypothetical protein
MAEDFGGSWWILCYITITSISFSFLKLIHKTKQNKTTPKSSHLRKMSINILYSEQQIAESAPLKKGMQCKAVDRNRIESLKLKET